VIIAAEGGGLAFPPLSHLVQWPVMFGNEIWGINKVVLIYALAIIITMAIFLLGAKRELVPSGPQNLAETAVEFIEDGVIMQTIGKEGLGYAPFLLSLFFFIFFNNIFGIIPPVFMPGTGRIALPLFLALVVWVIWNVAGIREHGLLGHFKATCMPSGVPAPLYIIIIPIELVSAFLVRPFSHMVRLFANLLAGHILLVTFTLLSAALWSSNWTLVFLPLPVFGVMFFVAFETLVSFLQAYVFTLLAGVYIGLAISHDH
jgi:F-type H+-transporting ATPase subunit a